jgi:hypothetical protein
MVALHYGIHMKHMNIFCGKNVESFKLLSQVLYMVTT